MLSPAMMKADGLLSQGAYALAVPVLMQQLRSKPQDALAHEWMAAALLFTGKADGAMFHAERALALEPKAEAFVLGRRHELVANVCGALSRRAEAVKHATKAAELSPTAQALNVLAAAHLMGDNKAGAIAPAKRAYAMAPEEPTIALNYAGLISEMGEPERGLDIVMRAMQGPLARDPSFVERVATNVLYVTPESGLRAAERDADAVDAREKLAWATRWGEMIAAQQKAMGAQSLTRVRDVGAERRLRVAFMSADFRSHSCAFFLRPLLKHLPRERVHVTGVHVSARSDEVTRELGALCDEFVHVPVWTAKSLAEVIAQREIDVLVECGGYTTGSGIAACCWRPAPVQLSYLGYPASTGLDVIDGRLVDALTDPVGSEAQCRERLLRMPTCFVCYDAGSDVPALPARERRDAVTFGCFSATQKFSRATYDVWGRVLREVADSRMLIKGSLLDEPTARETIWAQLELRGVQRERVELVGRLADPREHLRLYGQIDIALDTYPYVGTTTLCEAMLMGTPIVTRAGEQHVSRVGLSLLTHTGCGELVADSADAFVRIATELAQDGARRMRYHETLRERVLASAVCDGARFAADFAALVSNVWRERAVS
ncbi:MAG TPA: hypothetical protein VK157_10360 [Phycisphaerales bacterium]|nr:hypothetical protein [Phycisphaerales bacterium]